MNIEDELLAENIQTFHASGKRPDLYGKEVAKWMVEKMEKFFSVWD